MKILLFIASIFISISLDAFAGGTNWVRKPFNDKLFVQNKGQYTTIKSATDAPVVFGCDNVTNAYYFTPKSFICAFTKTTYKPMEEEKHGKKDMEEEKREMLARIKVQKDQLELEFLGANANATVEGQNISEAYYNYANGITHANGYNKLVYRNIYNNIDIEVLFHTEKGLKYNILARAGSNINDIKIKYHNAKSLVLDKDKNIVAKNTIANLIDYAPVVYYTDNEYEKINATYTLNKNNVVNFTLDNVNAARNITIDPWIVTAGIPNNDAYDIKRDTTGNVYIQGKQGIQKYSTSGTLLWTYNFVDDYTYAGDIEVDKVGNVYRTNGCCNGRREKLDANGTVVWSVSGGYEQWRLSFDPCKQYLFVGGVGLEGGGNLAKLDINTGALSNGITAGFETRSITTDIDASLYSMHLGNITHMSPTPAIIDDVPDGYSTFSEYGENYITGGFIGYNGIIVGFDDIYLSDGLTLNKRGKTTLGTVSATGTIPSGSSHNCSGLGVDRCDNVYAGSMNGIYKFDNTFAQITSVTTPGAVYDLLFFKQGVVYACGADFVGSFDLGGCTTTYTPYTITTTSTASCGGQNTGTINLTLSDGLPTYYFKWNTVPPQTTASIDSLASGTYTCNIIDRYCYETNHIVNVPASPNPVPNFSFNEPCENSTPKSTQFTDLSTNTTQWKWIFPTNANVLSSTLQSPSITVGLAGIYPVKLITTSTDGCIDSIIKNITIHPKPTAKFGILNACANQSTVFTDVSTLTNPAGITDNITSYQWDYEYTANTFIQDATTQNGSYTYISPSIATPHNAALIVTTDKGCSDTIIKPVNTFPLPTAAFTSDSACFKGTTTFTDNSTVANGSLKSWAWVFGGTGITPVPTANIQNPTYIYNKCNNAPNNATLVVTSDSGCVGVATNLVIVHCLPMPNFTFSNGCEYDDKIQFTNTSTNGAGTTSALISKWRLGLSPVPVTSTNASYTYTAAGNYSINLNVIDGFGCSKDTTKPLVIYPKPVANFMVDSVCLNIANAFTNTSTLSVPAGFTDAVQSQVWNYSFDGTNYTTNATTPNTSHIYTLPATQTKPVAMLIVTTNHNCADTVSKPVIVWPLPKANYSMTAPCYPTAITFSNASTIATGTDNSAMVSMVINWGNGQTQPVTGLNQTINYNHAASGNYISKLVVTSNHGCADSLNVPITVHAKPVANYTALPAKGCEPLCVNFVNISTQNAAPATETITTYNWNFGDYNVSKSSDNKATTTNAKHCYTNPTDTTQLHTSQLIITTTTGCKDTLIMRDSIAVYPLPVADFKVSPSTVDMLNPELKIKDESHLAYTITWNYNNGDVKQDINPTPLQPIAEYVYQYKDSGTYIIKQLVQTNKGCADSISKPVRVNPIYSIYIPNAFTPNGDNINDYFMVKGINIKELDLIIFDRWGEVIARITSPTSKGWDGTDIRQGIMSQQEVYNWKLSYTDVFNTKHKGLVGTVIMLK